jgi:hypothetical protein
LGFAICNGNNGTFPFTGLVEVACDMATLQTYSVGNTGGNKDAVVVEHDHPIGDQSGASGSGSTNIRYIGKEIESNALGVPRTDIVGESGTDKNMQPYICVLKIMKL